MAALLVLSLSAACLSQGPLVGTETLRKLRGAAAEVAKTGELSLVERMRSILAGLGEDEKELAKLVQTWEKTAAGAKPGAATRSGAAAKLRREVGPLVARLAQEADEDRRAELARWIVELDWEQAAAQEALGREREPEGDWLDAEQDGWRSGAKIVAEHYASAIAVAPRIERDASANPAVVAVCGGGNVVRGHGIELHSAMPAESLERILRQTLRAAAFSNGLLTEQAEIPALYPMKFVLLTSESQYRPALDESQAGGGLTAEGRAQVQELDWGGFLDERGWETVRWCSEAQVAALLLYRMRRPALPPLVQPCLSAGHLNWVCLRMLGTSMPNIGWREQAAPAADERTRTKKEEAQIREARWRSARQTLWGCRSWMIAEARAGRDPAWVRAMEDQEGKIRDENLLKATLVCELLQQEGRLLQVMKATGDRKEHLQAFEKALGEPVPEFEARWRRWLLQTRGSGVLQELEREAAIVEDTKRFAAALSLLNQARDEALAGQSPEIAEVSLDPDLCRAAELHARYLTLNSAQMESWPASSEEYADSVGFTPEGALAGGRSLIAFDGDPALAVRTWLGTFYHRLPLLSPGLFGAGFGTHEEVVVLDASSLVLEPWQDHAVVWPAHEAKDVPRRYTPEMPSPVPGADMTELGYPISLQLHLVQAKAKPRVVLELFEGEPGPRSGVDCHVITPEAPLFVDLAPENAWALIPKRLLAKKTRYTVRASWDQNVKLWNFTTEN